MLIDINHIVQKYNLNINGILHIGAHFGEEYKLYEQLNIKNIIFFEPIKKSFEILKNSVINSKNSNIIFINKALGNDNKIVKMYKESANQGQSSSILKPIKHLTQYPWIQFNEYENVEMIKLDDFNFDRYLYNFINIDVQGYELEVFKGGEKTLKFIDYIYSEVNRDEVYENCTKIEELDEFLKRYDFTRVETDWAGHTWGDALYIKIK